MGRKNYVIDFSNFEVNISINVKFYPGKQDEDYHMNTRNNPGNRVSRIRMGKVLDRIIKFGSWNVWCLNRL